MIRGLVRALALAAVLVVGAVVALGFGSSGIGFSDVVDWLRGDAEEGTRTILVGLRLPRIALAMIVGAALSGAGVAFQAVLRNPLADPYILGISGGAVLGAVLFNVLTEADPFKVHLGQPAAAFAGSLVTLALLLLARSRSRTDPTTLLLVGVILNAFFSAVILFVTTTGDPSRQRDAISFLVGSLGSEAWPAVGVVVAIVVSGLAGLMLLAHRLNVLALGEEAAGHLGVHGDRTLWTAIVLASMITAASVAFTGIIGFVGLIVPHLVRTLRGPDHRGLLPYAAGGGAIFLLAADTLARSAFRDGVELPVGVITALVGAPFFLWLFIRYRRG